MAEPTGAEPTGAGPAGAEPTGAGPAGAGPAGAGPAPTEPALPAILEALLFVGDQPLPVAVLAQVAQRGVDEVSEALHDLARQYEQAGRGFQLREVAGGWRLSTRAECAPYVERFVLDGSAARLTKAALETLAIIAYRQPVTRARISAVRGVNVDGVVRTLLSRGLVAEAGTDGDSTATLYVTTPLLLERLGLRSLAELPSLAPYLPDIGELDLDPPHG